MRVPHPRWPALAVVLAGLAAAVPAAEAPTDGFAAKVNDRVILIGDVLATIQPTIRFFRQTYAGEELEAKIQEAYQQGLDALIERALMLEEFSTRNIPVSEVVVADRMEDIIRDQFNNDRLLLRKALTEESLTLEEWKDVIRDRIVVGAMRAQEVRRPALPSPQAVYEEYRRRLSEFQVPEEVKLRMLMVRGGATEEESEVKRQQADRLRARILGGEDFAVLARQASEGSHAAAGGDWGWIQSRTLRTELAQAVARLEPGQISPVLEVEGGFYLLTVEGRRPAREVSFGEVQAQLREELLRAEATRAYIAWIDQLKRNHRVEILQRM